MCRPLVSVPDSGFGSGVAEGMNAFSCFFALLFRRVTGRLTPNCAQNLMVEASNAKRDHVSGRASLKLLERVIVDRQLISHRHPRTHDS